MDPALMFTGVDAVLRSGLTPFLGLPAQAEPCEAAGVVLGAPFDGGVLHRPGARLGPSSSHTSLWVTIGAAVGRAGSIVAIRCATRVDLPAPTSPVITTKPSP